MFPSFSVREPSFVLSINGSRALHKLVETCFCAKDKNLFGRRARLKTLLAFIKD